MLHFLHTKPSKHLVQLSPLPCHFPWISIPPVPQTSCPWEFSHGIMLLETFPLCIHVTRLAVTGCYCMSLKWCRCYQFHCRLWMLNMWIRTRGCAEGGGFGVTVSGSWSTHTVELPELLRGFFLKKETCTFFLWPPRAFFFPLSPKTGPTDERWRWTMANWYACKTEPKQRKIWLTWSKNEVVSASINSWVQFLRHRCLS